MRILALDIETKPILAYTWGTHNVTITPEQIVEPSSILCVAAQWYGSKEMLFYSAQGGKTHFRRMLREVHRLLSEADAVLSWNGENFDIPRLNSQFLLAGMKPPPPTAQIDLLRAARKKFGFDSNKLGHVAPLCLGKRKLKHEGWGLWIGCINGDADCWRRMREYCERDTALLADLYGMFRPWIADHPNMGHWKIGLVCTHCGSDRILSHGFRRASTYAYRRCQCRDCGAWMRQRQAAKIAPPIQLRGL